MANTFALALLPTPLAALSVYTLYHSYNSIQNVRAYEEPSERAAKYSNIANDALRQTRTTEGAGAVAVCLSPSTSVRPYKNLGSSLLYCLATALLYFYQ